MNSFQNKTSTPQEVRKLFNTGEIVIATTGLFDNYLQANLVTFSKILAFVLGTFKRVKVVGML